MKEYIMACDVRISWMKVNHLDSADLVASQSQSLAGVASQSYGTNTTETAYRTLCSYMDSNGPDKRGIVASTSLQLQLPAALQQVPQPGRSTK